MDGEGGGYINTNVNLKTVKKTHTADFDSPVPVVDTPLPGQ